MNRPKVQRHFRPQNRKYEELTPKIDAKTPINYRQRKLAGQSSALPANRSRQKEVNVFKIQHPIPHLERINKERILLSEEQIKNSPIYKLLEQEILNLSKRQQNQIQKINEIKKIKEKALAQVKAQQHAIKLQIWELRNQTMQLKDSIKQQNQESQRLMDELGISQADFQNQDAQQQAEYDHQNQQDNDSNPES